MNDSVILNGRYRCVEKIGSGGMSSVFLCHDNHLDKYWAMKVTKVAKGTEVSGFLHAGKAREVSILKSLDFPNFPDIVDAFIEDNKAFIITEYIEGENLKDIIRREGRIPEVIAVCYFEILLDALIYLHSQSPPILYLDMKPSNIMIKNDGMLYLIDFGIAGNILCGSNGYGTKGYSPPEQYIHKNACMDGRTDIFALGMTMYEILTGMPPDKDINTQRRNISRNRFINRYLKQIILDCTNPDINKRPQSEEVRLRLNRLKSKEKKIRGTLISCLAVVFLVTSLFMLIGSYSRNYVNQNKQDAYIEKMLNEASIYMENGRHTKESLGVISSYINGNFINDETAKAFIYEAGKAYFVELRDYYLSLRYFRKLRDIEKESESDILTEFPDATYYLELCEVLTDFDSDKSEVLDVINRFENFNNHQNDNSLREENARVIKLLRMEYGL